MAPLQAEVAQKHNQVLIFVDVVLYRDLDPLLMGALRHPEQSHEQKDVIDSHTLCTFCDYYSYLTI
jgi:hypothetical protein